ncbi:MAG: cyclase/dehydrase [Catenulispora sp.]|nr:cyclase/dehydrase [Catenulispora sp.]
MSDVRTSVDVQVPVRTAYNQWTQFESFPEFMSGVVAIRQLDDRHTHWVTEVAGARREFDAEIVEQLPDERISWRSTDGDVRHLGTVTFEPLAEGATRVTVDLTWEPQGLLEKAGDALGADRLQVKADLERFRRFIEERGAETGAWRGQVSGPGAEGPGPIPTDAPTPALAGTGLTPSGAQSADRSGHERVDVVDILMAQHEQVKGLMEEIAAADRADKQRLFADLVTMLKEHEKGEQRVVHPVTRSSVSGGDATANARLGEEQRADQLIAQMQDLTSNDREFDVWFERLQAAVLAHAEHEEREEFPKLRRDLAPERLRTMAQELVDVQNARN